VYRGLGAARCRRLHRSGLRRGGLGILRRSSLRCGGLRREGLRIRGLRRSSLCIIAKALTKADYSSKIGMASGNRGGKVSSAKHVLWAFAGPNQKVFTSI
jgi:hypothetical protein